MKNVAIIPQKSWQPMSKRNEKQCTNDLHSLEDGRYRSYPCVPTKRPGSPHAHSELVTLRLGETSFDLNGENRGYPSDKDMTRHEDRVSHADTRSTSTHSTLSLAPREHISRCTSPNTVTAMCRILRLRYECGHDSPQGIAPCAGRNYGGCKGQRFHDQRRPENCPTCGECVLQPESCLPQPRALD